MNPRVKEVEVLENYQILLFFDNSEKRIFDVSPYLEKGIFKQLKNMSFFYAVQVSDGTIQWPNEADFCPDTLYEESVPIE